MTTGVTVYEGRGYAEPVQDRHHFLAELLDYVDHRSDPARNLNHAVAD